MEQVIIRATPHACAIHRHYVTFKFTLLAGLRRFEIDSLVELIIGLLDIRDRHLSYGGFEDSPELTGCKA